MIREYIEQSTLDYGNTLLRFCQFIIYLSYHKIPKLSFGMVIIDCYSDSDAALDEFILYTKHDWGEINKKQFMPLFQEIQNDPDTEKAKLTLRH